MQIPLESTGVAQSDDGIVTDSARKHLRVRDHALWLHNDEYARFDFELALLHLSAFVLRVGVSYASVLSPFDSADVVLLSLFLAAWLMDSALLILDRCSFWAIGQDAQVHVDSIDEQHCRFHLFGVESDESLVGLSSVKQHDVC